jgi:hypothetical protein
MAKTTPCFAHSGLREILPRTGDSTHRPPCAQQRLRTLLPGVRSHEETVNHGSLMVIFQDYQFRLRNLAVLTRLEEIRRKRFEEDELVCKSFCCSGVKASFRKTQKQKLLQVTEKKRQCQYLGLRPRVFTRILTHISDCVLVCLLIIITVPRTTSSFVYS